MPTMITAWTMNQKDQAAWNDNINVSNGVTMSKNSLDNPNHNDNDTDDVSDDCPADSLTEVVPTTRPFSYILRVLGLNGSDKGLDGSAWNNDIYPMIASIIIVVNMIDRLVKDYFKIELLKTTP